MARNGTDNWNGDTQEGLGMEWDTQEDGRWEGVCENEIGKGQD